MNYFWRRNIFKAQDLLLGKYDLPSMQEIVNHHVAMLNVAQGKFVKTKDQTTLKIAEDILRDNVFLKENILKNMQANLSQTGSLKVKICDINKYTEFKQQYLEWKKNQKSRIIAAGGPSASDQTLISALMPSIMKTHDVNFYCRNYHETNVLHSANQSHARHGNALNADPVLSGRNLLPLVFKRLFSKLSLQDTVKADFIKVDVKLSNLNYLKQYVKNQINGIKQIIKTKMGQLNEHDINRLESVTSQEIQKVMEKASGMQFRNSTKRDPSKSMAIHLIFSGDSLQQIHQEQDQFSRVKQLKWNEIPLEQIKKLFPDSQNILTAFRYFGDFSNKFNMYDLEKEKSTQLGATWSQDSTISKVFLDKDPSTGKAITCGVLLSNGEFVPADKVHLSLGYKADYFYENDFDTRTLQSINVPATGVSTTFLMKKTQALKDIIEKQDQGSLELAIINSHWTIVGHNEEHVLMRATAGGNTGVQTYMPSHFLNLCANTRNVFGDAFVGIVSVYGCCRAINYKNSTQFAKVADGLVISYGKGGTGNTKRASQAYKALKYLGFDAELKEYFGQFEDDRLSITSTMDKICQESKSNYLYYDNARKSQRVLFAN